VWRELPPLPVPRHGIQAATIGGTIFVAGGGTVPFDYAPTDAHEALDVEDAAPCVAVGPGATAEAPAPVLPPSGAGEGEEEGALRITHLAVRPRRVVLRGWRAGQPPARIVVYVSREGWVTLRLPGRLRFSRLLHRGRNSLPLPVGPRRRLLPGGEYRLLATPRPPGDAGRPIQAAFSVVR
jgi:hypothetical protein